MSDPTPDINDFDENPDTVDLPRPSVRAVRVVVLVEALFAAVSLIGGSWAFASMFFVLSGWLPAAMLASRMMTGRRDHVNRWTDTALAAIAYGATCFLLLGRAFGW
jgi:uncharacterized membrane protein required for colicin V production